MEGNRKKKQNKKKLKEKKAAKIEAKIVMFCNRTQWWFFAYEFIELDVYVVSLSVANGMGWNGVRLVQYRTCYNISSSSRRISH